MSSLDFIDRDRRWYGIPEPIRHASYNDAVLHTVLMRYVWGDIVTWEEALSQAVIAQAEAREELARSYIDYRMRHPEPIVASATSFWQTIYDR